MRDSGPVSTVLEKAHKIDTADAFRYWGLFLGRPTSIKNTDVSILYNKSRMLDCMAMGPETRLESEVYEALSRLMQVTVRLTDSAHRRYSISDPGTFYFVAGVDKEMRDWYDALPRHLTWPPSTIARVPAGFFLMHQQYHTLVILLYRPFFDAAGATGDLQSSGCGLDLSFVVARTTCFDHALQVARIFTTYTKTFETRTMFVTAMQHAATAALAIVNGMNTGSVSRLECLSHLQTFADALNIHAEVYYPARVMSTVLYNVIAGQRATQHSRSLVPLTKKGSSVDSESRSQHHQPSTAADSNESPEQNTPASVPIWSETGTTVLDAQPLGLPSEPTMDFDPDMWDNILNTLSVLSN
jgi:hypothetical protein